MSGSPQESEGSAPRRTVSEFFKASVGGLFRANVDYVMEDAWDDQKLRVLHLIDLKPPGGTPLRYHYVYEQSDTVRGTSTLGIFMAWPRIVAGDHVATGETRHYFDQDRGFIVRKDVLRPGVPVDYEFLTGAGDPSEVEEPEMALLTDDLHNDILRMEHSEPLRPMSNLFRKFVMPAL